MRSLLGEKPEKGYLDFGVWELAETGSKRGNNERKKRKVFLPLRREIRKGRGTEYNLLFHKKKKNGKG